MGRGGRGAVLAGGPHCAGPDVLHAAPMSHLVQVQRAQTHVGGQHLQRALVHHAGGVQGGPWSGTARLAGLQRAVQTAKHQVAAGGGDRTRDVRDGSAKRRWRRGVIGETLVHVARHHAVVLRQKTKWDSFYHANTAKQ